MLEPVVTREHEAALNVINERVLTAFGRAQWQALVGELNRLAECAANRT